jgi:hypothetical protein
VEEEEENVSARTFCDILTNAVSLTTLHVFLAVIRPCRNHIPSVVIPTLRYLKVDGCPYRQKLTIEALLNIILAPELECLAFDCLTLNHINGISSYLSGPPTFPVLRTLKFKDTSTFNPITEDLIRGLPNITRLDLIKSPSAHALHILSTTALWPSLDTLQLELKAITPLFHDMLRYRMHIGHPIAKLRLLVGRSEVPNLYIPNMTIELLDKRTTYAQEDPSAHFDIG